MAASILSNIFRTSAPEETDEIPPGHNTNYRYLNEAEKVYLTQINFMTLGVRILSMLKV
eukprot:CAMPEP_0197042952 /NCGR_PEP_ID=MMETSP1384-20130603/19262_1 /TAXON_ID=29189 /ORGANISM="Ammonia sp." /LENGTH=58 /DNA_ID=CAMNT_0042474159 /DNA_START=10 /DNA_END=183 /DNA_ORIENTATION=+